MAFGDAKQIAYTGNNIQTAYEFFIDNGLSPNAAAGIIGNLMQESGVNPESIQSGGPGRGLAQWSEGGRWQPGLMTGDVGRDLIAQLNYIWFELNTDYKGALQDIQTAGSAGEAALYFSNFYEEPNPNYANNSGREANANSVLQQAQSGHWGGNPNYGSNAQTGTSPAAGGPGGPTLQTDSSGNQIPNPPGMNDIPALVDYIKQYFGADAWLLNVSPQVAQIIEEAVAQGRGNDTAYIQTLLEGTTWFKTTSKAYQTYLQQSYTNPADYNFNVPGSLAAQTYQNVMAAASQQGVQIAGDTAQTLAMNYLKFGWDAQQLDAALGDLVFAKAGAHGQISSNAGGVIQQLQAQAGQYLMNPNDPTLQSWAMNIVGGTQTMQQFDAYMKQNASLKWTGMAPQIAQGYTPQQITSGLQNNAAQIMEVAPDQVNFVTDPTYAKILDYAPPTEPGKPAPGHRLMTQSEESQYLKGLPQWGFTQGARDEVGTLVNQIVQTFGKAP